MHGCRVHTALPLMRAPLRICEHFAADGIFRRRRQGSLLAPRSGSDHGRVTWFDRIKESAQADGRGERFTASRRPVRGRGTGHGRAREPRGTRGRAQHGTKDQALPDLPVAVSERLGRRAYLPPLQVEVVMAQRRGQIVAAGACSAKVGTGFAKRTCSNKKTRAKSDSTGTEFAADGSAASDRHTERAPIANREPSVEPSRSPNDPAMGACAPRAHCKIIFHDAIGSSHAEWH